MIAGTNSGCGKTTVACGIMAALTKRGFNVQPFKAGPDYIDPMFHTFITGNDSRNLDSWLLDEKVLTYLFGKSAGGKDLAIIEGVMGIYDGFGPKEERGSSAHLAKILKCPVILVVNAERMALSLAALLQGFCDFDPRVEIKGVILNNVNSKAHYALLKEIIEERLSFLKVVGYLPSLPESSFNSRHLGLVLPGEIENFSRKIDVLARKVEETIDLQLLTKIALGASSLEVPVVENNFSAVMKNDALKKEIKLGVAKDRAFNFYYKDNLDLLEMLGAKIVYFSPLEDETLPEKVDGLYIGGGYPEVWAKELEHNFRLRRELKEKIYAGLPVYAECGGLMYMTQEIKTLEGDSYKMAGVLPASSEMTKSLQRFGYVKVKIVQDCLLGAKGWTIQAHEFHHSTVHFKKDVPACWQVHKEKANGEVRSWDCGFQLFNLLAGYPHLHFWNNPVFALNFLQNCKKYKYDKKVSEEAK